MKAEIADPFELVCLAGREIEMNDGSFINLFVDWIYLICVVDKR